VLLLAVQPAVEVAEDAAVDGVQLVGERPDLAARRQVAGARVGPHRPGGLVVDRQGRAGRPRDGRVRGPVAAPPGDLVEAVVVGQHQALAQRRVAVVDGVVDALALVDDDRHRLERGLQVVDRYRVSGGAVHAPVAGHLPRRLAGEDLLLGRHHLEALHDGGVELADGVVALGPRPPRWWLRPLDP